MTIPGLVRANNLNDVVDRERAWDNLGSSLATGDIAIPTPSLDLNFAANKSLVDDISGNNLITFSRASTGTFVGSDGLIQTAASGVPRFDHNPATGESLGLLVEEARTNLATYSIDFSQSVWTKSNSTITTSSIVSPDGTLTASLLLPNLGSSPGGEIQRSNISGLNGISSIYVKRQNARYCGFTSWGYFGGNVYFDLDAGNIVSGWGFHPNFGTVTPSIAPAGNGWYRIAITATNQSNYIFRIFPSATSGTSANNPPTGDGTSGIYIWGAQVELGSFPTSYIPTVASAVTRAADVASIAGANFSSWYRSDQGTFFVQGSQGQGLFPSAFEVTPFVQSLLTRYIGTSAAHFTIPNGGSYTDLSSTLSYTSLSSNKYVGAYQNANSRVAVNGALGPIAPGIIGTGGTGINIGRSRRGDDYCNSTIARLTCWPSRLYDVTLQYITQPSIAAINLYAFNYAINGKDVLALNAVRNASTRNFIFIKGLLSAAQPRLTAAAASTSSALTLPTNALPKLSPTSSGNYFFASGITLSGVTTSINGTNALSIATSPFSGSTATAPLLFRELRPQANWRFTEPMPSGTIASPEFAIPFETNDFVLFMKAGPN